MNVIYRNKAEGLVHYLDVEQENGGNRRFHHGGERSFESKLGFTVSWYNLVPLPSHIKLRFSPSKCGIYIRLCRPRGGIKEDDYFSFSDGDGAQERYNMYVAQVKSWDESLPK
jgi:hypothetical protein